MQYRGDGGVDLPVAGCWACVRVKLRSRNVYRVLVNLAKWHDAEVIKNWLDETLVPRAVLDVVHESMSESNGRLLAVNAFGQDFSFALCTDFFGTLFVINTCAFFNALTPEGPTHDPIWGLWTPDELEGHGNA